MPALLLHLVNQNQWTASVANTEITYNFLGDTTHGQLIKLHQFAAEMQLGEGDLADSFANVGEITNQELNIQLFGSTDQIMLGDNVVYGTVGEEMIIDDVAEAGDLLLQALITMFPI